MKKIIFLLALMAFSLEGFTQAPSNDNCGGAILINDARNYCSSAGQYSNVNATASFTNSGPDVWFVFEARDLEVKITVTGGTLQSPEIKLYNDCGGSGRVTGVVRDGNTTIINDAGLTPSKFYYVSVSGAGNTGTFQLCLENYKSEIKPGQDNSTASLLCSSTTIIREISISGSGNNDNETANTCIGAEKHSGWYKWTAQNSGTLVFTITPTKNDDLDWVLFELGPEGNTQPATAANAIRCAAGHGISNVGCPNEPIYTKTGLNFTENDVTEAGGCGAGQNGMLKAVDMKQGYVYALVVNNFTSGNNGFEIKFTDDAGKAGTGLFKGPTAKLSDTNANLCTPQQSFTFTANITGQTSIQWYFGQGASIPEATTAGPFTITYSTPGLKTVFLQVKNDLGCSVVETKTFMVSLKPEKPSIMGLQPRYCIGETLNLSTPAQADATYAWTGPDSFTSTQREISIPVNAPLKAGTYFLTITIFGCTSDPASVIVPPIGQTPTASFTSSGANLCTPQQAYSFTSQSTNYQTLRWNFGAGASVPAGSAGQAYSVIYTTSGTKSITLEAIGSNGCVSTFSQQIDVTIRPDLPIISANKPDFCLSDTIRLSAPAQPNVTYQWTGPNNFSSAQREVEIPVTSTLVAGTYNLVLTRGSCSTASVSVVVPPIFKNPVAAFRADPTAPAKLSFPITIRFFNESTDGDSYLWDFGDSTTSTDVNPEHTYTRRGNFDVTLTVFKSDVCNASVMHGTFMISEAGAIFIPNTFTPNNDAVNDQFVISMNNIRTYRIQIYNRYGVPMYSSNNLVENWDGTYKNEPVPVGTYYYVVDAVDFDNNVIKKSGSVTILR